MNSPQLPDTLHQMLTLAVADARSINRNHYIPSYGDWHTPKEHGLCAICLAGGVLAGTLSVSPRSEAMPFLLNNAYFRKLEALNSSRCGEWIDAFHHMHRIWPAGITRARLKSLPPPSNPLFHGWDQFDAHLESIETFIPLIRNIELEFLGHG